MWAFMAAPSLLALMSFVAYRVMIDVKSSGIGSAVDHNRSREIAALRGRVMEHVRVLGGVPSASGFSTGLRRCERLPITCGRSGLVTAGR